MTDEKNDTACRRRDWITALLTTLGSGAVFFYYMAPEVTLQDSGELVTGAFTLGVPHPPGYPLWAFLGFVWSHFIVPFGNPAWRIGTMSVVTGALTVGVLTLLMVRSIRLLLQSLPFGGRLDGKTRHWIAMTVGASTALLFAFNRGVWLWACVSEMRVLNVFSFVLIGYTFFAWTLQPDRRGFLYLTVLLLGLSMANHQTIAVMAVPIGIGAIVVGLERCMTERLSSEGTCRPIRTLVTCLSAAWELMAAACLCLMAVCMVFAWLKDPAAEGVSPGTWMACALGVGATGLLLLFAGRATHCWSAGRALKCAGLFLAGIACYVYMPLAASTNPPMNWGYTATKAGFLHSITRGQYTPLEAARVASTEFLLKVQVFVSALANQYSVCLTLLGLGALAVFAVLLLRRARGTAWMAFVIAAFLTTSLGLLTIINPRLDRQEQEITIKFFAPAHGFYAMWIGYGIATLLALSAWLGPRGAAVAARCLGVAMLALPVVTFERNKELCALRGHDFGYLFGSLMFEPGGGYPAMEKNAILFGGTDPGRFVPTYMIFCESRVAPKDKFGGKNFDRSDVYIITQNALADATYLSYIRDHYDTSRPANDGPIGRFLGRDSIFPVEPIHIPGTSDTAMAFQRLVREEELGLRPRSGAVKVQNGRVSVNGAQAVMEINGILAQWIFERNRDRHAFYVEESYVIPWMYPYLRPAGVIMKMEREPLPSPQSDPAVWRDIVSRDRAYWDKLSADFLGRSDFRRNNDAKRSFSKLRTAIAGLYAFRQMEAEAEYAFRQALQLCPESPEASFRLADLYMRQRRYADAGKLIEDYQRIDTYNPAPGNFLNAIRSAEKDEARRVELEAQVTGGRADINAALELTAVYLRLRMDAQFEAMARMIASTTNLPGDAYLALAHLCEGAGKRAFHAEAVQACLRAEPGNLRAQIEQAAGLVRQGRQEEAVGILKQAVARGGDFARAMLKKDSRFAALAGKEGFLQLLGGRSGTERTLQSLGLLR